MYIVLLSGGSGKRLWPLSNDLRSKQYIRITSDEESGKICSMLQRVWNQINHVGNFKKVIVTASKAQTEIIKSQLDETIDIAIEPERRDTFPAVALSCLYLIDKLGASENEIVCFLPVDPYVEKDFFVQLSKLEEILNETNGDVAIMGVEPEEVCSKYGYIIPYMVKDQEYFKVKYFKEKPSEIEAENLIRAGALWNCGVFGLRISEILNIFKREGWNCSYEWLYENYGVLPKISFDYEVLEKANNVYVLPYEGKWSDLGTWNALAEHMEENCIGECICDGSCTNTNIVNELDIPTVAIGTNNLMIVSSFDGILVLDKDMSNEVKNVVDEFHFKSNYEERQWGFLKTLDFSQTRNGFTLLRKITIFENRSSSYHYHNGREEVITILNGRGEIVIEGVRILLSQGTTITIPSKKRHALRAFSNMEYLETHIGKTFGNEDINRITFNWDEIRKIDKGE